MPPLRQNGSLWDAIRHILYVGERASVLPSLLSGQALSAAKDLAPDRVYSGLERSLPVVILSAAKDLAPDRVYSGLERSLPVVILSAAKDLALRSG